MVSSQVVAVFVDTINRMTPVGWSSWALSSCSCWFIFPISLFSCEMLFCDASFMKQHAQLLADYLVKLKDAKVETEAYSGPVMLYQQVVASAFGATLFGGSTALVANREPLVNGFSKKLTVQSSGSIELKLGKRIVSKDISVVLKPHIRYFQKVGLLGSYDVDGEGVVPPDELVLVNNGVLKNLMRYSFSLS